MKCLAILFLKFLLLSNFVLSETIPIKSKILKESSDCIKDSQPQVCKKLISEIEKLQFVVFDQNRFKCQSSLLGLQSEIIEVYYFKNFSKEKISYMIPYVIKNC
tara:strand:- start:185 stop:496 length:312 start_codon:yes stop_codon:yes gene_type:complete